MIVCLSPLIQLTLSCANVYILPQERFEHLRDNLRRTERNYERTYEAAMGLRSKYRMIESDLIALQFVRWLIFVSFFPSRPGAWFMEVN